MLKWHSLTPSPNSGILGMLKQHHYHKTHPEMQQYRMRTEANTMTIIKQAKHTYMYFLEVTLWDYCHTIWVLDPSSKPSRLKSNLILLTCGIHVYMTA